MRVSHDPNILGRRNEHNSLDLEERPSKSFVSKIHKTKALHSQKAFETSNMNNVLRLSLTVALVMSCSVLQALGDRVSE